MISSVALVWAVSLDRRGREGGREGGEGVDALMREGD